MRYFGLHQDVFFERGASGGALYDFMRRHVEPLSPEETSILDRLESDFPVDQVEGAEPLVRRLVEGSFGSRRAVVQRRDRFMPVLKLNLQGLVEPPLFLGVLHLSLTSSCGLSCGGCGTNGGAVWQGCNGCELWPGVRRGAAWTTEAIDQFAAELEPLDVRAVFFNGGDPLTEPELLLHAIQRLQQRPRPPAIVISTNGTAATPELLDRLAERAVTLNFVLLGTTPEEYERACGSAAVFDVAMDAIAAAQVRAIPFNVTLRLDGATPADAARRREWATSLGAKRVYTSERVQSSADGGVAPAASLATTGRGRVPQITPEQFFIRRERHPCLSGTMAVGADLAVRPCPMIEDRTFGHIGLEPLRTVFVERRHEKYWQMTKADVAGCSACEFRFACADCAAVDLAKRREPALHAAVCSYDPARGSWRS